jgi:hypothetical protein
LLYNASVLITAKTNSNKSSSQDRHQLKRQIPVFDLIRFTSITPREIKRHGYKRYLPCEVWWDFFPTEEQLGFQHGTKKSSQEVAAILEAVNQPERSDLSLRQLLSIRNTIVMCMSENLFHVQRKLFC